MKKAIIYARYSSDSQTDIVSSSFFSHFSPQLKIIALILENNVSKLFVLNFVYVSLTN